MVRPTRTLLGEEANSVDYDGFRLPQAYAYDGLLKKVEDQFGCGLRLEENKANWQSKKDSIRHFQQTTCGILSPQGQRTFRKWRMDGVDATGTDIKGVESLRTTGLFGGTSDLWPGGDLPVRAVGSRW